MLKIPFLKEKPEYENFQTKIQDSYSRKPLQRLNMSTLKNMNKHMEKKWWLLLVVVIINYPKPEIRLTGKSERTKSMATYMVIGPR